MRILQKLSEPLRAMGGSSGPETSQQLEQARAEGAAMLAAGDEAIRRALSGANSQAFLRSSRQLGGQ